MKELNILSQAETLLPYEYLLNFFFFLQIPGGAAKVLNQGSSLTSTCHALANAIVDKLNEEHNIDVDQKILANILVNNNQHVGAVWPDIYDNYGQRILLMDRNSKEEKWISIKKKTVKRVEKFINGQKHLLSYLSKDGHHCVFLKEQKGNSYECVNSWGEKDSYPLVPVENPENRLWMVQVEFEPASNSEFMTLNCISNCFFALVELPICIKSF